MEIRLTTWSGVHLNNGGNEVGTSPGLQTGIFSPTYPPQAVGCCQLGEYKGVGQLQCGQLGEYKGGGQLTTGLPLEANIPGGG